MVTVNHELVIFWRHHRLQGVCYNLGQHWCCSCSAHTAPWSQLLLDQCERPVAAHHLLPLIPTTQVWWAKIGKSAVWNAPCFGRNICKDATNGELNLQISKTKYRTSCLIRETHNVCLKTRMRPNVRHPSLFAHPSASVSLWSLSCMQAGASYAPH